MRRKIRKYDIQGNPRVIRKYNTGNSFCFLHLILVCKPFTIFFRGSLSVVLSGCWTVSLELDTTKCSVVWQDLTEFKECDIVPAPSSRIKLSHALVFSLSPSCPFFLSPSFLFFSLSNSSHSSSRPLSQNFARIPWKQAC